MTSISSQGYYQIPTTQNSTSPRSEQERLHAICDEINADFSSSKFVMEILEDPTSSSDMKAAYTPDQ